LLGKKLYQKKFNKQKVNSTKELNVEINDNNMHLQKSNEKENKKGIREQLFSEYIKTEIVNRKNKLNSDIDKETTLQNELINNNKLGLLSKCEKKIEENQQIMTKIWKIKVKMPKIRVIKIIRKIFLQLVLININLIIKVIII
jgi:hypothetical protein